MLAMYVVTIIIIAAAAVTLTHTRTQTQTLTPGSSVISHPGVRKPVEL